MAPAISISAPMSDPSEEYRLPPWLEQDSVSENDQQNIYFRIFREENKKQSTAQQHETLFGSHFLSWQLPLDQKNKQVKIIFSSP